MPINALNPETSEVHASHGVPEPTALPGVNGLALQRLAHRLYRLSVPVLPTLTERFASTLLRAHLPATVEIGEGTVLGEGGMGVFLHPRARIGRGCHISHDVTVGEWTDRIAPVVGDRVHIGPGAKLVGGIHVGEGAVIGANAVVDRDVAPGAYVEAGSWAEFDDIKTGDHTRSVPLRMTEILEMPAPRSTRRNTVRHEPIRLAQFTRAFYIGGTEVQVMELLRGLDARYKVSVGVLDTRGPLHGEVERMGYAPATFPIKGGFLRPNTALQVARLARWFKREGIELVHVHDFSATLLAVPAARLAGCKVVVSRLDLGHHLGPRHQLALAKLTREADHVIANADCIRNQLLEREGHVPEHVSVVRNGLDIARFDARVREGLDAPVPDTKGAPVVIHVANMGHPVKRQEDLLAAVAHVNRRGIPLHAFLVGDGPRRPEVERRAAELGVREQVHFLGYRRDVPALYKLGAFGVLCSSAEGLSNAIIEGMAAGLPMVVTHAGGNPELVRHGELGLVVPVHAPVSLALAFERLLADPAAARQMGARGREFVEQELSLTRMVAAHDGVYRRLARGAVD